MAGPATLEEESAEAFIRRVKSGPARFRRAKDIGRQATLTWSSEAMTLHPQSRYKNTVFVIERLRLASVEGERLRPDGPEIGDVTYRFAYYTRSRSGKWWWGQYAPIIPAEDLEPLLRLAQEDGTLLAGG